MISAILATLRGVFNVIASVALGVAIAALLFHMGLIGATQGA